MSNPAPTHRPRRSWLPGVVISALILLMTPATRGPILHWLGVGSGLVIGAVFATAVFCALGLHRRR